MIVRRERLGSDSLASARAAATRLAPRRRHDRAPHLDDALPRRQPRRRPAPQRPVGRLLIQLPEPAQLRGIGPLRGASLELEMQDPQALHHRVQRRPLCASVRRCHAATGGGGGGDLLARRTAGGGAGGGGRGRPVRVHGDAQPASALAVRRGTGRRARVACQRQALREKEKPTRCCRVCKVFNPPLRLAPDLADAFIVIKQPLVLATTPSR
jgi:hypothetical protein